jgi:hypothetical protein
VTADGDRLPRYDELPVSDGAPPGSSWGVWGADDTLGCLNLLTPERVRRAAGLVRRGRLFPLNWDWQLPDPPLFGRSPLRHRAVDLLGEYMDDVIDDFNTQSSSQWDGFRHLAFNGQLYNGLSHDVHGVDQWASKGIAGRAILVDVVGWRASQGDPLSADESSSVSPDELQAIFRYQNSDPEAGDILLVHLGWTDWYRGLDPSTRTKLAKARAPRAPGLRAGRAMVALLWDLHIAAVASDTPSFEVVPFGHGLDDEEKQTSYGSLHHNLLPLLGMPIGELWDLGALARDCAADRVYECFLTSAPIRLRNGIGSPPNAIAIK